MKTTNKFISWIKSPSSDVFLFLVALVLLNLVASKAFFRLDITQPRSYSLSQSSIQSVQHLEEPLSVKVFFSKNLQAPYSSVEQYVKDILVEYKNKASSNFSYEYFDVEKPENQKLAKSYGLNQIQIREIKNNEVGFKNVFMGIVLTYADQIELLDAIESSDGLEYKITTAINKIVYNTNIFSGLSDTPVLTLYKTADFDNFQIANIRDLEKIVEEAYENANKKYNNKIVFQVKNPDTKESISLGERYGIQTISWNNEDGTKSTGALGIVLEMGNKFRVIPLKLQNMFIAYGIAGLDNIEENICLSLEGMVSKTSVVAYVTGHGERDVEDTQNGASGFKSLLRENYTLKNVNLAEENIPVGCQCVIVNGPKTEMSDAELYKLDQFLLAGGNLMLFLDPFTQEQFQTQFGPDVKYNEINTGIEKLLSKYGIEPQKNYVLDERCFAQMNPQYGKLDFYYVPMMQKKSLSQKSVISRNLGYVLFMAASSLNVENAQKDSGKNVTVLAKSSDRSWTVKENFVLNPMTLSAPQDKSEMHSENLCALVEGSFESAFDKNPVEETSETKGELSSEGHLSKSLQNGKIFVATSSEITGPNILQQNSTEPIAYFVLNAVDYMNGNQDFCLMRTKNLALNTLIDVNGPLAFAAKMFNQFGLALIVAICGVAVLLARKRRREEIRMKYNPDDPRHFVKKNEE